MDYVYPNLIYRVYPNQNTAELEKEGGQHLKN